MRRITDFSERSEEMSSNNKQEVVMDFQKHEASKEKRTKKMKFKDRERTGSFDDIMVVSKKKKTQPIKKEKYSNFRTTDFDSYYDEHEDYQY